MGKRIRKIKRNGWILKLRKDYKGVPRPMRILYRNGIEKEHHWLNCARKIGLL